MGLFHRHRRTAPKKSLIYVNFWQSSFLFGAVDGVAERMILSKRSYPKMHRSKRMVEAKNLKIITS